MAEKNPPKWAYYLLKIWLSEELEEEIGGDLVEAYHWRALDKGTFYANWMFIWEVIKTLKIKNKRATKNRSLMLLNNYLKIAWRFHRKAAPYALLNILCLSTGIVVFILCYLYIQYEEKYDQSVPDAEQVFRIAYSPDDQTGYKGNARAAYPLGPRLKEEFGEVEDYVRIYQIITGGAPEPIIQKDDKKYFEPQFYTADPQIFDFFGIELTQGDKSTVFSEPNSLVLTEAKAVKYFGDTDPLGQFLTFHFYDTSFNMQVTGVMKSIKDHSHTNIELLAPMQFKEQSIFPGWTGWGASIAYTYVRLNDPQQASIIQEKLPAFIKRNYPDEILERFGDFKLITQPLRDIHLHSHLRNEIEANGNVKTLNWIWLIAGLSLIMSIINFINLSTAWANQRAKEVSVRKVMGSKRHDIIKQFILESMLMSFASLAFSLLIVYLIFPAFQQLVRLNIDLSYLNIPITIASAIAFTVILGLLSGLYPSFVVSFFEPKSFNSQSSKTGGKKGESIRSGLVISQFVISILFLIVMISMRQQLDLIRNGNIGIDKNQLVILKGSNSQPLVNELNKFPFITNATTAGGDLPGIRTQGKWKIHPEGRLEKDGYRSATIYGGGQLCKTLGAELLKGRDFSTEDIDHNIRKFLVNEQALAEFGWEVEDAIGKSIGWSVWNSDSIAAGKVVGVIKDFHHESLHQSVKPIIMVASSYGDIITNVNTSDLPNMVSTLEEVWSQHVSDKPFEIEFMDERIDKLYEAELVTGSITSKLTIIALLITAFGLLSLASYMTKIKLREVGVRKVFGATSVQIMLFFYRKIVLLLAISGLIALPVGLILSTRWLDSFAVRTSIGMGQLTIPVIAMLLITLVSVSVQTFKVSFRNPSDILRHE